MCIRVLGASNREYANTGDVVVAAVGEAVPNMPLKGSEVVRAVIVRTRKGLNRDNGMTIRFDDNAAVVINREGNPQGTRVFGPVARELREFNFAKTVSPAPEVLRIIKSGKSYRLAAVMMQCNTSLLRARRGLRGTRVGETR